MSAASEEIREFLRRLNAVRPNVSDAPTFLDKIEALLKERDQLLAAAKRVNAEIDHADDCQVYDVQKSDTDGCSCPIADVVSAIDAAERR